MATDTLKQIIARAVTEPAFRELLLSDSAKALEGYKLTEAELAVLKALTAQEFDTLGGELEERVSRAGVGKPSGSGYISCGCINATVRC